LSNIFNLMNEIVKFSGLRNFHRENKNWESSSKQNLKLKAQQNPFCVLGWKHFPRFPF